MKNIFVLLVALLIINGAVSALDFTVVPDDKVIPGESKVVPKNDKVVPNKKKEEGKSADREVSSLEVLFNDELVENELYQMSFGDVKFKEAYTFAKTATKRMNKIAAFMMEHQDLEMIITGYTDNQYEEDWSLKIGLERAKLCYDYLIEKGVQPERMTFTTKGKAAPIVPNDTKENRVLNNRVEFELKE